MKEGASKIAADCNALATRQAATSVNTPDLIIATDMLDLPVWIKEMNRLGTDIENIPMCIYMHENQLTYPMPTYRSGLKPSVGEKNNARIATNIVSQIRADRIFFNSRYHLDSWFSALTTLTPHDNALVSKIFAPDSVTYQYHYPVAPDQPLLENMCQLAAALRKKSSVLPVGIDLEHVSQARSKRRRLNEDSRAVRENKKRPLRILWNQRWEHDKNPATFFNILSAISRDGIPYELIVCGEQGNYVPKLFTVMQSQLAKHIIHWGYASSRDAYLQLLSIADVVISTSNHEFFGISLIEATAAGAYPLVPTRLSYTELFPKHFRYTTDDDLSTRLRQLLNTGISPPEYAQLHELATHLHYTYDWNTLAAIYDAAFSKLCFATRCSTTIRKMT